MTSQLNSYMKHLHQDLPAGIVVFLVALPLCLGVALASGAPLFSGIIAGLVGGILVSWASGSQLSVSGPAAGLTVIVFEAIETLGGFGGFFTQRGAGRRLANNSGLFKSRGNWRIFSGFGD